jgi:predicted ATPase
LAQNPSLDGGHLTPRPAPAMPLVSGNLPERLSSFLGRDTELGQLSEAVRSGRLVTLIGPGGVGKTTLAVEAASRLRDEYPSGAWLVELAGVTEAAGVGPAAAAALEALGPAGGDVQSPGSAAEVIVRHLVGRSLVVVLDNCEHVIVEAATLAHALVSAVPGLRLVATSREPLGVPGEVLIPVPGLAPTAAVELFVDRARAVQPSFNRDGPAGEIIDSICSRLDGLPLAIELAAARLRALPLATLAERLDDRFALLTRGARTALPRQQTLRAVVDWSYDLLFEDERRLFARLSVFVGGCELGAVEVVCADPEVPAADVLDVISQLVDKSLVTVIDAGDGRFGQLQTLWHYGGERLVESGEADRVRAKHAAYYRQMAEDAYDGLRGSAGPQWRDRLSRELGNLKAALDWYRAIGDNDAALSLAVGMAWLWFINTDFAEGARWLDAALAGDGDRTRALQASAQAWRGYCVGMSSSPAAGLIDCEESIAVLKSEGHGVRLAEALVLGASVLVRAHEFDRSLAALDEARALLDPAAQGWLLGAHDLLVAWNMASLGRLEEAETAARSSLQRLDAAGEVLLVVSPLNALAGIAAARGDLEGASIAYEALLERCRATGQHPYLPFALVALATVRARQGDDVAADDVYEEAIRCCFNPWLSADAMVGQAAVARRLGDLVRARALLDTAASRYTDADLPAGQSRVLAGLAWWAIGAGQLDSAVAFAVDAVNAATAIGDPETQLLADCALSAAQAVADPTPHNTEAFLALAQHRAQGLSHRSLTDESDVVALAVHLAPAHT